MLCAQPVKPTYPRDPWALVLGSASPRRREILEALGLRFFVAPAAIDEAVFPAEEPGAYLDRIVDAKAAAVECALAHREYFALLVADTTVYLGTTILGKPASIQEAFEFLSLLNGKSHVVATRYALRRPGGESVARTISTVVSFAHQTEEDLWEYATTGEGLDKAGGYAIQGLGTFLVESISGSYSAVVGLPAAQLLKDLRELGWKKQGGEFRGEGAG